jgi:hypothetical protein
MSEPISLAQQIEEVERKIKLRESAFRSYGRTGNMRSSEAEFHIVRMKAADSRKNPSRGFLFRTAAWKPRKAAG